MADGRKRSGPPTDSSSSPSFPRERAICLVPGIRVPWYCCVRVLYFKAPTFFAASYSYDEPHRVSWAELREDLHRRKAFRGTARMSEAKFEKSAHLLRPALQKNERKKISIYVYTWYLTYEHQVLLCTCFVFQGATFCGQLLVRELSQRWFRIVSHLQ